MVFMPGPRLFLIDAFNLIFRAYHARQRTGAPPMRTSRGSSTEAVYIFHNMLRRIIKVWSPEYLAVAYESEGPTFRDQQFAAYKANRTETPQELRDQFPVIERMLGAMGVPVLKLAGFEADDLIGTAAVKSAPVEVVIITSDKDMLQLVDGRVAVLDPMKNDTLYDPAKVKEFKGVSPARIADLLALVGDTSDNIPGAPGIGDKGAVALIEQYGSVEEVLEHAAEVSRKAYRESLENNKDQILLSKSLATIDTNAPIDFDLAKLAARPPDREALAEMYKELEFFSFLKDLEPAAAEPTHQDVALESPEALIEWLDASGPVAADPSPMVTGFARGPELTATYSGALPELTPRPWIVYDYKSLLTAGTILEGPIEDILLYAFLVLADPGGCEPAALSARYLDRKAAATPAAQAAALFELAEKLRPEIESAGLRRIYDEIDLPLAPVLAKMERTGIRVDRAELSRLSAEMDAAIQQLTASIYDLAKHPFNINSPQQLGKILFEEMAIPSGAKTGKTKNYSTAADVLEALAPQHEIVAKVLEYRQLTKLKGTYVDALPLLMDSNDRVHTTFNPAGAATGRLSSSNPNLQNIPVRTSLGKTIRAAFVPEPGWTLLVADYSQIELRLLAHLSKDKVLTEAFRNGEDIHTRTAAEVLGIPPMMITPDQRRGAKAVNFGIVYGQTAFGLAAQLGISKAEADRYITAYFERYAGVKTWIERQIAEVRKTGYTLTLHGRQRPIPDMTSKNPNARSFAERTAVNTPLQGTAADLIKVAMINLDKKLDGFRSRMLLQVHDELVLECPPDELDKVSQLVKQTMESVMRLEVPLLADTNHGPNWRDAK
jgi:DNA polymerase I